jgi:hypothetical protein
MYTKRENKTSKADRKVKAGPATSVLDLQCVAALIPSVTRPSEPLRDKTTQVPLEEELLGAKEEVEWRGESPIRRVTL